MEAYAALAKCYLKLNMNDQALENLNLYYDFADKLRFPNAQVILFRLTKV